MGLIPMGPRTPAEGMLSPALTYLDVRNPVTPEKTQHSTENKELMQKIIDSSEKAHEISG